MTASYVRLANFFDLYSLTGTGTPSYQRRYSNATPGKPLSYEGFEYPYLSFIYQGAAKNRTGDNLESALILSTNEISTGLAREAINNRWHIRVCSVLLNPAGDVSRKLTVEYWLVASMVYNPETVEVLLSSGIDAVGANAPTRTLTQKNVGLLPITANISTQ